jgi:micrococcal nuclease
VLQKTHHRIKFGRGLWLALLLASAVSSGAIAQSISSATVVSTIDGDTLQVNQNGQTITVRLACIDAPEGEQPGGTTAAERLRQLLPQHQAIQLIQVDTDRYGRTVAVVFANRQSINLRLVRDGQAVVYPQYLSRCPNSRNDLLAAQEEARSHQRGFWAQANPVMPWDWRQRSRSTRPSSPEIPAMAMGMTEMANIQLAPVR